MANPTQALAAADAAQQLAIQALGFLAADPERLGRFLALTGLGPTGLRAAAQEPRFLAGVMEHVVGDEDLLLAFAAEAGVTPVTVTKALALLAGPGWEADTP